MSTYPYPMPFEVDAIYTSSKDLPPNPLRDALPPQLTRKEVLDHIKHLPPYSDKDRHEPSPDEKFLLLDRILQVFYPLVYYVDLQRAVDRAVRNSYEHRNPLDPRFYSRIVAAAQSMTQFNMPPGLGKSDCCGFAIAGDSGIGKSLTLTRTLQLLPQVINHTSFNGKPLPLRQVPWIKVNCPEYASTRALEVEMLKAYDTVLGTDFVGLYDKKGVTAKALASHLARVACYHGTGVAVIDELQNLALAPSGGQDEMLGFFSNFMHTFGQPIILVGTVAAVRLLSSRFSQARRATGYSNPIWTRLERDDPDWEILLRALWKYQYTEVETCLDDDLSDVMHECTQGIADNVAKLYRAVQEKLIYRKKDKQIITPAIVNDIAAKLFGLQRDHLAILSGDKLAQPERERADGKSKSNDYLLPEELSKAKEQYQSNSGSAARAANSADSGAPETPTPSVSPEANGSKTQKPLKSAKAKKA